ncbi:MAG: site-2 protease family protein [Thermoanaerobaculia bacterium]
MPEKTSKNSQGYVLRFDRGRYTLNRERSALTASTEDERLTVPVRIGALLAGLFVAALGLGAVALAVYGVFSQPSSAWGTLVIIPFMLIIGGYGIDLVGRGITGRQWSRQLWKAAERGLATGFRPWHGLVLLLLLFAVPVLGDLARKGLAGLAALMIPVGLLAQVVCHETGHLMAAGSVGYRPRQLVAGPMVIHLDGPRPRVSLTRSWMMLFGGLASFQRVRPSRGKDFWVAAAGPLANLTLAALALDAWGWPTGQQGFAGTFLRTFIGFGIAMGLFNLIPLPRASNGFALDGREMLDLLRGRR